MQQFDFELIIICHVHQNCYLPNIFQQAQSAEQIWNHSLSRWVVTMASASLT